LLVDEFTRQVTAVAPLDMIPAARDCMSVMRYPRSIAERVLEMGGDGTGCWG